MLIGVVKHAIANIDRDPLLYFQLPFDAVTREIVGEFGLQRRDCDDNTKKGKDLHLG